MFNFRNPIFNSQELAYYSRAIGDVAVRARKPVGKCSYNIEHSPRNMNVRLQTEKVKISGIDRDFLLLTLTLVNNNTREKSRFHSYLAFHAGTYINDNRYGGICSSKDIESLITENDWQNMTRIQSQSLQMIGAVSGAVLLELDGEGL